MSRRGGFLFGVKLVRGAYMEQERERAAELQYEDPVHPDYKTTNTNYNSNLLFLLEEIKNKGGIKLIVASHNQDTLQLALSKASWTERVEIPSIRTSERSPPLPPPSLTGKPIHPG